MAAAFVARKMGVPATIVVPSSSPQLVVQRLQDQGAAVKIVGKVTYFPPVECVFNRSEKFRWTPSAACD